MKIVKLSLLLIALSQLGACAVMSKSDCLNANWQSVGFDVGVDGERDITAAYNRRAEVCAKYGARANWSDFKTGHAEGIDQFCQLDNAVLLGIKGRSSALSEKICPERQYPGFYAAFSDGYKLHELNALVYQSEYELDRLESLAYRYRDKRAELKHRIKSGELSSEEISRADYKRKRLRRDIIAVESDIYACRERLARHRAHARSYADLLELEYSRSLY